MSKCTGNENDVKASQSSAPDSREQEAREIELVPVNNSLTDGRPNNRIDHEYQSESYVSDTQRYNIKSFESSQYPALVRFRDLKPDALLNDAWTCIASRRFGGARCLVRLPIRTREHAILEIKRLQASISQNASAKAELTDLARLLVCKRWHQYAVFGIVRSWIEELSVPSSLGVLSSDKDIGGLAFAEATDTRLTEAAVEFKRYDRLYSEMQVISSIVGKMRRRVELQSARHGFIYIFSRPGSSMIKIGCTRLDVKRRLLEWSRTCHFQPCLVYCQPVCRVQLAEKLVHSSLSRDRMCESTCNAGNGCGCSHYEWFETDQKRAILTVQRWADWLDLDPYPSGRLDAFWDAILFETTSFKSLDTFHHWIERVTEDCSRRGENSWRGRADGRFQNCNESFGEETQSPPISPVASVFSTDAQSMISGTTLDSTLPDEQTMSAVLELVTLLLEDEVFQHLQAVALARTDPEKFERNFLRLLRMYSVELQTEASTISEYHAVRFIKTRAPDVASCLRSQNDPSIRETSEIWKSLLKKESEKQESLQRYLLDLSRVETETSGLGFETFESSSSYEPDDTVLDDLMPDYVLDNVELDVAGSLDFPNFESVKEFMVQSKAFRKLRDNLTAFVFPPDQRILKGLLETTPEKLNSLSSIESSTSSFEHDHDHDHAEVEDKNLFSDPEREHVGAAVNRPIFHVFRHWIRKLSERLVFCCLRAAEDLGMYKSPLCKGFIRLNWTCLCEQSFSQDYPESQLSLAQQLQFMLMQSGYRATVLAHNKRDTAASHVLRPSLSNIAQASALSGDMELDMQTSNSHSDTANSATISNLHGGTSQGTSQGTNFRIDSGRNNASTLGSLATNPHTIDNVLKDQAWKLRDQWLLLCFYHNKHLSRAVHMKVSKESHDVNLIRSFQKEYAVARGLFSYYLSWKRVTNIKFVRFRLTKDPYFEADLTTEAEIPERNAIVEERPIKPQENVNKASGIDLALVDDDWGPPEGWCDKKHWDPCPVDPRPNLKDWMMHLWEHPHNSQLYLALKRMHVRLATSGEPIISRYRKSGAAILREHSNNIRHLCARFGYFRGRSNRSNSIKDIELQNSIAEIPHPQQAELDQLQQRNTKKGRFFTVNTPKKVHAKLKADLDEPPYGWGLFFEERTVIPTFIKVFIFIFVISLIVSIAVICFKLAHEHGYAAFGMGSFTLTLATAILTSIIKFFG